MKSVTLPTARKFTLLSLTETMQIYVCNIDHHAAYLFKSSDLEKK